MFCCDGLRNMVSCAGERGHAVVVRLNNNDIHFYLQSRGISFDDLPKMKPINIDVIINVSAEIGLRFCPFCGHRLSDMARKDRDLFVSLAHLHEKYFELTAI